MEWPFQNLEGLSKFEKPLKTERLWPFQILKAFKIRKILKILKIF